MRPVLALATLAIMAISAPVFAQSAGAPGATGDTGSLSGSNPPGGGVDKSMKATPSGGMRNGGATKMDEGRAAAPEGPAGDKANDAPQGVRGDQSKQDQAK